MKWKGYAVYCKLVCDVQYIFNKNGFYTRHIKLKQFITSALSQNSFLTVILICSMTLMKALYGKATTSC